MFRVGMSILGKLPVGLPQQHVSLCGPDATAPACRAGAGSAGRARAAGRQGAAAAAARAAGQARPAPDRRRRRRRCAPAAWPHGYIHCWFARFHAAKLVRAQPHWDRPRAHLRRTRGRAQAPPRARLPQRPARRREQRRRRQRRRTACRPAGPRRWTPRTTTPTTTTRPRASARGSGRAAVRRWARPRRRRRATRRPAWRRPAAAWRCRLAGRRRATRRRACPTSTTLPPVRPRGCACGGRLRARLTSVG